MLWIDSFQRWIVSSGLDLKQNFALCHSIEKNEKTFPTSSSFSYEYITSKTSPQHIFISIPLSTTQILHKLS